MGARGPSKKPTAFKVLTGNPGKRKLPENEPKPEQIPPDCPAHLDEEGQKEWIRIVAELREIGILTRLDRAALAMYCAAWSDWVRYSEEVRKTAAVVKSPSGYPMISPYVSLADKAFEKMKRMLRGLGLTPGDRAGLGEWKPPPAGEGAADPLEAWLGDGKSEKKTG